MQYNTTQRTQFINTKKTKMKYPSYRDKAEQYGTGTVHAYT